MNGVESAAFVPQVVDTLHSWFTPTVLFVLLNLVIVTIAVTSRMRLNNNNNNPNNLRRSPSLLTRLSSISFSRRTYEEEPMVAWSPEDEKTETVEENVVVEQEEVDIEEKKTIDGDGVCGLSQRAVQKKRGLGRSKLDSQPLADLSHPPPPPLPGKMHKYSTFEKPNYTRKAVEVRPPPQAVEEEDEEVNAKADDFINKFKQQLKLQRLESLVRYNDMLGRSK